MKFMRTLAFALLLPALSGHSLAAQANSENPKFSIEISVAPEVAKGADIDVAIKITNISEELLGLEFGNHGGLPDGYRYDVRDELSAPVAKVVHNDPLYPKHLPGSVMIGKGEIRPGKSWDQIARISDVYSFDHPGKYTIQVSRRVSNSSVIYSNIITITVLPEASDSK